MAGRTIGYHVVKSGYGLWLPGDERGSWSDVWDEMIGYVQPHTLHEDDSARKRMAQERMQHEPVTLNEIMIDAVLSAIGTCEEQSQWRNTIHYIERHNIRRGLDTQPYSFIAETPTARGLIL